MVVPLYMPNPKEVRPEGQRPVSEAAGLTVKAFQAKNAIKDFQDAIQTMLERPDSPSGRITEARFRDELFTIAQANLTQEEVETIFPVLSKDENRTGSKRRASKRRTSSSKEPPVSEA
eukprot:CAMPEP_0169122768 /NCGR_PEP_ID=MMETSP1015-20121227/33410_1 /TAXON_ID=342587 /ORGANISM="Karlodinium micrum, Strain CCMP2283" /LENGTH=117 /DNA_ID=CAMNT_0009186025 /DNA_START=147 /DNA_END=500 /DNA_ORIENTATION=+